LGAAATT
jgi:hypothetical protein